MRFLAVLLCILLCAALVGCEAEEAAPIADISEYLRAFEAMDYGAMFEASAPKGDIAKDAFTLKYDNIFTGLGVKSVRVESVSTPDIGGTIRFSATYVTEEYGDYTNAFAAETAFEEGVCKVKWDYSLIFPEMEAGSSVRVDTLHATRGEVFAADGSVLAANAFADTLYMDTGKVTDIAAVSRTAAPLTGLNDGEVTAMFNDALENGTSIVVLGTYFAGELTQEQRDTIQEVPGLGIDDKMYTTIRDYPMREYAAHIVGYTGFYDEHELPEGYTVSDRVGRSGLEEAYETQLRGADGKIVYIEDKWGKMIRTLYHEPVQQGQDLRLTLRPQMQRRAYDTLATFLEGDETGAVVVMDAQTGFVEAIASYPSYDNNVFTFGVSEAQWDYYMDSANNQPLYFRATQGQYPPGSVFKPFTAVAALDGVAITKHTVFDGVIEDNQWLPTEEGWIWEPITRVDNSGTPLKLHNALTKSDNIYFAFAALRLGDDALLEYFSRIGMEEAVPFDLPVMRANLVNTSKIERNMVAVMGYGQGELLITPLQLAAMYTAFADGSGDMKQPILVEKRCQTDGLDYATVDERGASVWVEDAVSSKNLETLLPILRDVVQDGTGFPLQGTTFSIAGKTGTAEIGSDKSREISWFAGYWEDGYYDRLVVVMVDTAAEEGTVKFDIARELLEP